MSAIVADSNGNRPTDRLELDRHVPITLPGPRVKTAPV